MQIKLFVVVVPHTVDRPPTIVKVRTSTNFSASESRNILCLHESESC